MRQVIAWWQIIGRIVALKVEIERRCWATDVRKKGAIVFR